MALGAAMREFMVIAEGIIQKFILLQKQVSLVWQNIWQLTFLNTTYKQTQFYVASGDALSVDCYNFPNDPEINHLKVTITSKELQKYLISLE